MATIIYVANVPVRENLRMNILAKE